MTYVVIGLLIVLVVLLTISRADATTPPRDEQATRNWDADYSYLYYIDRDGQLTYDRENCRGCIENAAERLRAKGFTVTEVVLGTKYSGDL